MKAMKHHKIALHYYTEQDFVRPRKIAQNGYRLFDEKKIYTFFKETDEKKHLRIRCFFHTFFDKTKNHKSSR